MNYKHLTNTYNKIYDLLQQENELTSEELKSIQNICYGKRIIKREKHSFTEVHK